MAKRKKQEFILNKYFKFSVAATAIAGIALMFLPALSLNSLGGNEVTTINMWQAAFGTEITIGSIPTAKFNFSFLVLLIPLLFIAAGVIPFFIPRNLGTVITLGCFVTAAVFSFMLVVFAMPSNGTALVYNLGLTVGSILVGIVSIVGAGLSVVKLVV